jgi:hypothetical protein
MDRLPIMEPISHAGGELSAIQLEWTRVLMASNSPSCSTMKDCPMTFMTRMNGKQL